MKYDDENIDRFTYEYGANGQAVEVKDTNLNRITRTDYDLADRPCQVEMRENSSLLYRTRLKYDVLSNLESFVENVDDEIHKTTYTYDRDNRVTKLAYDGMDAVAYTCDELGRVTARTAGPMTSNFSYAAGGFGTNSTTPLVKKVTQNGISFEYEYDSCGNIVSEKRGNLTTTYAYDALGQLICVNDPHENATWVYSYDRGGNITSKAKYAYTTGTLGTAVETIPYTYGDSNWKDKLTAYNGTAIPASISRITMMIVKISWKSCTTQRNAAAHPTCTLFTDEGRKSYVSTCVFFGTLARRGDVLFRQSG